MLRIRRALEHLLKHRTDRPIWGEDRRRGHRSTPVEPSDAGATAGRPTVLGGVEFPDFSSGFDTHSDGDVVAHAIIDALAGALGVGSLGDYFPEDDPADQDARSILFLTRFQPVMAREGARVINLDCTIFCRAPRITPVVNEMRSNIATGLECSPNRINVKGKTNDGFGPEGEGNAISATVVVQLELQELTG